MDTLNDDCQLNIIKYLSLAEQFTLFEANIHLNSNLCYAWKHQQIFSLKEEHFDVFKKNPELLHVFLSSISSTVRELDMEVTLNTLKCWTGYNFPKIRSLSYRQSIMGLTLPYNWEESDLVMQLVAKLFPDLNHFKPYGQFEFIHLRNWKHLRKLDMLRCYPTSETCKSAEGFEGLQMLEELTINDEKLSEEQFKMLVCLPRLQTLIIGQGTNYPFRFYNEMRVLDIEKITLLDFNLHESELRKCLKLRHLMLDSDDFKGEDIPKVVRALPLLERLDIVKVSNSFTETELWQTVACGPSLEFISMWYLDLDEHFYSLNRQPMEMALKGRSTPLTIECCNEDNVERIYSNFKHPNLIISFQDLDFYHDSFTARFKFYPLAT